MVGILTIDDGVFAKTNTLLKIQINRFIFIEYGSVDLKLAEKKNTV